MNKKLSPKDKRYFLDLLDLKKGHFMPIEDTLRYLYIRYVWKDQTSDYSLLDIGKPLPLPHNVSLDELDRATPEGRDEILEKLIYVYSCWSEYDRVYVEALKQLLLAHLEHDVEVPGILKVWAYKAALIFEPKFSPGQPRVSNEDHRVYVIYQSLKQKYGCSDLEAYEIIAELKNSESPDTVRSAVKRAKTSTERIFDKRNPLRKVVKNYR